MKFISLIGVLERDILEDLNKMKDEQKIRHEAIRLGFNGGALFVGSLMFIQGIQLGLGLATAREIIPIMIGSRNGYEVTYRTCGIESKEYYVCQENNFNLQRLNLKSGNPPENLRYKLEARK